MTDTPFKAGETDEMVDALSWALGRLRGLAIGVWKPDDPAWQDMARARALLPTPPAADDLAAARAEIERLRKAIDYAVGQIDKGAPDNAGDELRRALLPSPPDAKPALVTSEDMRAAIKRARTRGNLPPAPEPWYRRIEGDGCYFCGSDICISAARASRLCVVANTASVRCPACKSVYEPAPERERLKGWVNVYPKAGGGWRPGYCYDTRSEAARMAGGTDRTACIDLSQHYVGEGLEP